MSFVLHRAERADVLSDALADLLVVPPPDAFTPDVVAVHSRGVERWLSHRLAARLGATPGRSDGVCANLEFPFPGRLVQSTLASVTGVDPASDPWRPERLAWPLLEVVEASLGEPWLRVLAGHLGGAGQGADDDARRDRRFAVVRHLADLFDRYAVHRPAMVLAWSEGLDRDGEGIDLPADACWQAELWRRVAQVVGDPSPAERAVAGCVALSADPTLVDLPSRLCLFGLTRLPASYLDVLLALAEHRDVHVLGLHPSPATWGTTELHNLHHPLLRAWGRDSHEMQVVLRRRLAGRARAADVHHPLEAGEPTKLLARLQSAIRADDAPPLSGDDRLLLAPGDRTVQVHACHGRARQAEVVRDAITHLLADDPTLEPRDIVVMCPDIDELSPLLRAAFDDVAASASGGGADRSLRQTNPVLGAVAELIALVDARLTASQVLRFAALVPARRRFGFDDDDLERIADWIGVTGTRWGLDADHRAPYDLAAVDAGTWDAGLQRLLLGVAMSEDDQRLVGGTPPLDDVDSGDIDLAGRFAELVGRLGDAVRSLTDPRPVAEWTAAIDRAADRLLDTPLADAWQRTQLDRLLADVQQESGNASGARLRLAEVRDLLADRLAGQPSRAAFRTGDLTMCTLVPMRSVPHRVVCLVGLDDGAFPRGGAPNGDDVLLRARHIGDHDLRAEDRQLRLDAVLAAGDALVITYAGRDARTNEVLPPAVPVNELLDVVDATVRTAGGGTARLAITSHHPLQPSDRRCFVPGALGTAGPWGFDPRLLAGAEAAIGSRLPPRQFLDGPLPPLPEPVIALDDVVAVLHHPVRAFLRQRLGLSLRVDDDRPTDAMVIDLDALAKWGIGDRLLTALLAGGDADAICAADLARGLLPPGDLGRNALSEARSRAEDLAATARRVADGPRTSLEVDVNLADGRQVVGTVPGVIGDLIRQATFSKLGPKPHLRAWVHLLAGTASHPDRTFTSVTIGRGPATFGLPALDPAVARDQLADLVALRDDALRGPLPLYCATSHAFVLAARAGAADLVGAASKEWTTTFGSWDKEDRDAEHLLVHGGQLTIEEAMADPRFETLARGVWDPILDAHRQSPT
ncbi:exodeoxyribonuclease V subunit gamma [soil metagenome]